MNSNIDKQGFRPNVGIVLLQSPTPDAPSNRVLWARRVGGFNAWQFPQGGINASESTEEAVFRELYEEIGVSADAVTVLGQTASWLRYRLPRHMRRNNSTPGFVGQKQKWFLLQLHAPDDAVRAVALPRPRLVQPKVAVFYKTARREDPPYIKDAVENAGKPVPYHFFGL